MIGPGGNMKRQNRLLCHFQESCERILNILDLECTCLTIIDYVHLLLLLARQQLMQQQFILTGIYCKGLYPHSNHILPLHVFQDFLATPLFIGKQHDLLNIQQFSACKNLTGTKLGQYYQQQKNYLDRRERDLMAATGTRAKDGC